MKLQHLRFFVAAVDCGGIVRAAERLRVSQPAVSAALKTLKQDLGEPLFEPTGHGRRTRANSKALEFYSDAVDIVRKCETARTRFRRKESRPAKLRLGVLQTIASRQLASFSGALSHGRPDLRLQVREGGPIRIQEWLRGGHIDLAWTVVDRPGRNIRQLWQEAFVVLAGPAHRFARNPRGELSLSDLEGESLVLRGACEMPRGALWPESLRMRIIARTERDELALSLVAEGLGIAIAPQSLVTDAVVARHVKGIDAVRSIGLKWRADLNGRNSQRDSRCINIDLARPALSATNSRFPMRNPISE
jgi:DNA-binding transcriptional LysR family regulator